MPTKVSSGIMMTMAASRGMTRAWNGLTPITCMASTSWVMRMEPISAAKDEAERPASRMAVISTASSRRTDTATSWTVNTPAPSWDSRLAPSRAMTAPMKKLVTAMIGMASSPARSP